MPATVNPDADPDPEAPFQGKDEPTKSFPELPPPRSDSKILRSLKESPMSLYTRFCRNHKWCFGIVILIAVITAIIGVHFCGWNGDYCIEKHANFNSTYPDCFVSNSSKVGDGLCDDGEYNTVTCRWDGGDCNETNKLNPPPGWPSNSSIIAYPQENIAQPRPRCGGS